MWRIRAVMLSAVLGFISGYLVSLILGYAASWFDLKALIFGTAFAVIFVLLTIVKFVMDIVRMWHGERKRP